MLLLPCLLGCSSAAAFGLATSAPSSEAQAAVSQIVRELRRWHTGALPEPISVTVDADREGLRLTKVAGEAFAALGSKSQAEAAVARGALVLNGESVEKSRRVRAGDVLTLQPRAASTPSEGKLEARARFVLHLRSLGLRTVFEDDDLAVVYKPSGIHTKHGTKARYAALEDALPAMLSPPPAGTADAMPLPLALHRLDVPVAGLVVVGKTRGSFRELARQFEEREVRKVYHALLVGDPAEAAEAAVAARTAAEAAGAAGAGAAASVRWCESGGRRAIELTAEVDGLPAHTTLEVVELTAHPQWGSLAHVRLMPHTGRTHQLRVHAAGLGCPIVGDDLYWPAAEAARGARGERLPPIRAGSSLFLQSCAVSFAKPSDGSSVQVAVAEAAKFRQLRARARSGAEFERRLGSSEGGE